MTTTRTGGRGVLRGLIADRQPLWQNALASTLTRLGFGTVYVCDEPSELATLVERRRPHLLLVDPEGFPDYAEAIDLDGDVPRLLVVVSARGDAAISKCSTPRQIAHALHDLIVAELDWATLTKRELEILRLAAESLSNRAIARRLWLSDQTVKFHLAQAYRKLGVSNRRAAVERVRAVGLLLDDQQDQPRAALTSTE